MPTFVVAQRNHPASSTVPQLLAPGAGGTVRALVVGIDRYRVEIGALAGAVADARDIADTLARAGVKDVAVLLDEQASRAKLTAALADLAQRARPGDAVIFTFAGHGAQEPALPGSTEPDGREEFLLLQGFGATGEATAERLLDDEVFDLLGRIAARGVQTIFLADVCYGGGMSKGVDPRVGRRNVRGLKRVSEPGLVGPGTYYIRAAEDRLQTLGTLRRGDDATTVYPTLTFISGVDDAHEAPEVEIAGEATLRGAASYIFARALEGLADREGEGAPDARTTRRELLGFVRKHVRIISKDRQSPVGAPQTAAGADVVLFAHQAPASGAPATIASVAGLPPPKPQAIATLEAAGAVPPQSNASPPELYWDPRSGDVVDRAGSVVAYAVAKDGLAAVAARAAAFQRLVHIARGRALDLSLSPVDRVFADGEPFQASVSGLSGRYLAIVNLAGDGRVQMLFPTGNADPLMDREALTLPLRAAAPFGSDTLLLVASTSRRHDLEIDLKLLDGRADAPGLVAALERHLRESDRLGLATYSTRPR